MKPAIAAIAAATLGAVLNASAADDPEAIAKSSGCLACHAMAAKKIGPSFKDTAAKYKGDAGAEAKVLAKLGDAKVHPSVKAKPEEVKAVVKWILSL